MTKLIKKFIRNEDGASAAEYALILAVIGGLIAVAAGNLGGAIEGALQGAADTINGPATPPPAN